MSHSDTNKKIDALAATAKLAVARVDTAVKGAAAEAATLLRKADEATRQASLEVSRDIEQLGVKAGHAVQSAAHQVEAAGEKLATNATKAMKKTSEEM
jgi:hypothetical protein